MSFFFISFLHFAIFLFLFHCLSSFLVQFSFLYFLNYDISFQSIINVVLFFFKVLFGSISYTRYKKSWKKIVDILYTIAKFKWSCSKESWKKIVSSLNNRVAKSKRSWYKIVYQIYYAHEWLINRMLTETFLVFFIIDKLIERDTKTHKFLENEKKN